MFDSKPRAENSDIITHTADVLVTSLASYIASHSATCYVFAIQRHYHSLTYRYMHALSEDRTTCNVTAYIDDVRTCTGDVINEFHSATTCCAITRCPQHAPRPVCTVTNFCFAQLLAAAFGHVFPEPILNFIFLTRHV